MTDKQQVEEITRVLRETLYKLYYGIDADNIPLSEVAKALYLLDYRRVPENAVVLTKEEFWKLSNKFSKKELDEIVDFHKNKTRKETAKEIFNKLRKQSTKSFLDYEGNICHLDEEYVSMREIEAVLKQYGVEVEE